VLLSLGIPVPSRAYIKMLFPIRRETDAQEIDRLGPRV
jgi:hypothetical protein